MPNDTSQQNNDLIRRIEALEQWKRDREEQQITFPLDEASIDVINRYFMRVKDIYSYEAAAGSPYTVEFITEQKEFPKVSTLLDTDGDAIRLKGNGLARFTLFQQNTFPIQKIDPGTDELTTVHKIDGLQNGSRVIFFSEDNPPTGISGLGAVTYKIANLANRKFTLTDTDGTPINFTDTGNGRLFMQQI